MNQLFRLLLTAVVGFFVLAGAEFLKANAAADLPPDPIPGDEMETGGYDHAAEDWTPELIAGGEFAAGVDFSASKRSALEHGAKLALGSNADAVLSLDLITDGGAGNQRDDGVTSGSVAGRGTTIAIEVFATGVRTSLAGYEMIFDLDPSFVALVRAEDSIQPQLGGIRDKSVVSFGSLTSRRLSPSGFLARAVFETTVDVTGREFSIGIEKVTLAQLGASPDELATARAIAFNATLSADFDGDGTVGFSDFLVFAGAFGSRQGDGRYNASQDLDSDGSVDFTDFLIFAEAFGSQVPPSGGGGTPSGGGETVTIADANLREVIADSLGKARNAPISRDEMATLTHIDASNRGVRDLTGLEHATNLTALDLGRARVDGEWVNSNDITDPSPLSRLTNLTYLSLTSNRISSISSLSNLTDLTQLHLGGNQSISDISALSNLTRLTSLNLWDNNISNITALSNLRNLTYLSLSYNRISSISALSNLTNLTQLRLGDNSISDISALSNLKGLERLYLYGRRVNGEWQRGEISDLSPLSNLTNLTYLNLTYNRNSSISSLSNLTNLTQLHLGGNQSISDISALSNLTGLTRLNLWGNYVSEISALSQLTDLSYLGLSSNRISNISPLVANVGLGSGDTVNLKGNPLSNASRNTHIPTLQRRGVKVEFDSGNGHGGTTPPAPGVPKLYWTDWGTDKIQRSNLDGSDVEDLVTSGLVDPVGIALDVAGGKMYWTDFDLLGGRHKIQRSNLDGSDVEDLVTSGLVGPSGIALDMAGRKMYWTEFFIGTAKIQRSNLDGSDVEDLVTSGLKVPAGIALDVAGGKMYWTDEGTAKIQRSSLDGSDAEDLVTSGLAGPSGIALDMAGGKMYWTDEGTAKIQRSNVDGSDVEDLVTSGLLDPNGIALDVAGGKMYWTDFDEVRHRRVGARHKIQRSNLDGSDVEDLVTSGLDGPNGIALALRVPVVDGTDLVVRTSVDDNTLTTGQSFTLSATVRNQGNASAGATTLRYYRSSNATISRDDTEVGTDPVSTLSAGTTSAESISLNAPSDAGTYYYGACVDNVSGESNTDNNCSSGVSVTVSGGGGGGSARACTAGLVVKPDESCNYKNGTFYVNSSGRGTIISGGIILTAGNSFNERGTINGVRWNFRASRNSGSNSWTIHTAD